MRGVVAVFAGLVLCKAPAAGELEWRRIDAGDGLPLQLVEAGPRDAPGILFLHGATLSSTSWLQQLEGPLAERWHLVAFDLRGHGNSGKAWSPSAYADSRRWANDVATVLAAAGLERALLVAWSYGGHVTMDYIRHHGTAQIAGLVLVGSTGGILPFPRPDPAAAAELAERRRMSLSPDPGEQLEAARRFVADMAVAPVPPEILDRQVAAVLAIPPYVRQAMVGRGLDNADLVPRLDVPILFVVGDADRVAAPDAVAALAARLPAARVSRYADTGHMPFLERQARFDAEVAEFATRVLDAEQPEPSKEPAPWN